MARKTLEEIIAAKPDVDFALIDATTDEEIRRHQIEDGENPDAPMPVYVLRRPGQRGKGRKPALVPMNIRVAPETLAAFQGLGQGWQTRVRDILDRVSLVIGPR